MENKDDKYDLKRDKKQKGFRRLTSVVFAYDGTRRWYLTKNNLTKLSSSDEAQYCEVWMVFFERF
jgi:hypothetical protein